MMSPAKKMIPPLFSCSNEMKRIFFAIGVLLLVFTTLSVTTSAIDTPWLPLTPDNETTAGSEVTTDAEATDSSAEVKEESITPDENTPDEKNDTAVKSSDSENTSDEENGKSGCGIVIGICTVLIALVSVAMVCTIKARKVNL